MTESPFSRLAGLERLAKPAPRIQPGERCEMCGTPVADEHSHVADLENRGVLCACRACYLLFTHQGASVGRYRAIPERYRYDPAPNLAAHQWDELQIPVRLAFFFHNSGLGQDVCFYPGPGGAMESELPLDSWATILAENPEFADLAPDVEALLVQRADRRPGAHTEGAPERGDFEFFGVPIDACYELVGLVRMNWKGFDGGQEAWAAIDHFFARLREQSIPVRGGVS
ncbi:MAG TPA: DUF5947 family protein [Mycobacteriales bacterium]|jgi:hypothetical protein|nr:DUF5947 family protein [Mycobacteriales bacterium]